MFRKPGYAVALAFVALSYMVTVGGSSLAISPSSELPHRYPLVYVYPEEVIADVGETFTINVMVYNLTAESIQDPAWPTVSIPLGNLYGFDVKFTWDSTIIKYVSHNVTAPVEKFNKPIYPSNSTGVLHTTGSFVWVKDIVNERGNIPNADPLAKAWFAYAAVNPAAPFNGNGVIFTMTFTVLKPGASPLQFVDNTPTGSQVILAGINGYPIGWSPISQTWLNPLRNGFFRTPGAPIADFTVSPSTGVANKSVHFDASVHGNLTPIQTYAWNFGDGTSLNTTVPAADHIYAHQIWTTTASLVVVSESGICSANVTRDVRVVVSRDLTIEFVHFVGGNVTLPDDFTLNAFAWNLGNSGIELNSFFENATITLCYNASRVGLDTNWVEVGIKQVKISSSDSSYITFSLKSTALPLAEAFYRFKLNISGIPSGYEANVINNEVISEPMYVERNSARAPDINGDGTVDILDLVMAANAYGGRSRDAGWNLSIDIAPPFGVIDIRDLVTCAAHYGEKYQ